jgi:non-ribosomal peptide synthetase component F
MSNLATAIAHLPPKPQPIGPKWYHPSGSFTEFSKEDVEQSIPDRFEQIVAQYPDRIAVKTRQHALTYDALNNAANRIAQAILAQLGESSEPVAQRISLLRSFKHRRSLNCVGFYKGSCLNI